MAVAEEAGRIGREGIDGKLWERLKKGVYGQQGPGPQFLRKPVCGSGSILLRRGELPPICGLVQLHHQGGGGGPDRPLGHGGARGPVCGPSQRGGAGLINTVTFPGLGLEFTLNRVALTVLGRPIYWYGIIIVSGLILAVILCSRWGKRFGINEDQILDMMIFAVPAALVAIRAYYVIFNLSIFQNADGSLNWGKILNYGDGGLAIYGAIISSVIVLLIFCHVRKISFLAFADLGVHGLFIGQLVGRWGNFMNVEAFGGVTTLPWRMCGPSIAEDMLRWGYVDRPATRPSSAERWGYILPFL